MHKTTNRSMKMNILKDKIRIKINKINKTHMINPLTQEIMIYIVKEIMINKINKTMINISHEMVMINILKIAL